MTIFVEPPLNPTPEAIVQIAVERMQEQYPNWNPNPASPEYRMFLSYAAIACETIILAFNIPEEIIRFVGEVVYQERPREAVKATATATFIAADTHGYEIEAGQQVLITPTSTGEAVGFEVKESVIIGAGQIATSSGGVTLVAEEAGESFNGITGPAVAGGLVSWLSEVQVFTTSANGVNAETLGEYTRRITELATLVTPRPILAVDFANYVRLKASGVARAVAIDEYNAETSTASQERCVTVAIANSEGNEVSAGTKAECELLLKEAREASFKSFVINPTYHSINVKVKGKRTTGYEIEDVRIRTESALKSLLSPATWGTPPSGDTTSWINNTTLRYQDAITAVNNVAGFDHYIELKLNAGEVDIALSGVAPLTRVGTLEVTIE